MLFINLDTKTSLGSTQGKCFKIFLHKSIHLINSLATFSFQILRNIYQQNFLTDKIDMILTLEAPSTKSNQANIYLIMNTKRSSKLYIESRIKNIFI